MSLGSFALVGLKITGRNMRSTSRDYYDKANLADITVIGSMGIDDKNVDEIDKTSGVNQKEYGYLKDVTLEGTTDSLRVFSKPKEISQYKITKGTDLKNDTDIVVSDNLKNQYKIGDTIKLDEKEDLDEKYSLINHTYQIVGFADSPEYSSYLNMGASTSGDGNLYALAFVNEDNFDTDYYMIARLRYEDSINLNPYSDEYRNNISKHEKELNDALDGAGEQRLKTIKNDIQKEIDDGQAKIDDANKQVNDNQAKLDNANKQIKDGKDELANANKRLKDANQRLTSGKKTLDEKWNELQAGKAQLANAKSSLIAAENKLDNAYNQIVQGENELSESKSQLAAKEKELADGKAKYQDALEEYKAKKAELDAGNEKLKTSEKEFANKNKEASELLNAIANLEEKIAQLNVAIPIMKSNIGESGEDADPELIENLVESKSQLEALKQKLSELNAIKKTQIPADTKEQMESAQKELSEKKAEFDAAYQKLEAAKATLDQKQAEINDGQTQIDSVKAYISSKENELNTAKNTYAAGKRDYENGLVSYNQNLNLYYRGLDEWNAGFNTLNKKEKEYQANLAKYNQSTQELKNKKAEYEDKLAEFKDKKKDADKEIKDGEEKIADSKELMDSLEEPTYTVATRRKSPGSLGYTVYQVVSEVVDKLSKIFPVFLYLVAALVTLTTMTRFVDEERLNTGTLVALGYDDKDITKKFTRYGLLAGGLGSIFGIILGHTLFPLMIYNAYGHAFIYPRIYLEFYPVISIVALALSILSSVLPAYIVAKRQLQEKPTALLLAKPPAKGSEILLEKIPFIWDHMSFTQKVTARNLFRYKKRMLMTIFGVAGGVTLLFAGFSSQKSIADLESTQFDELINYDMIVSYNPNTSDKNQIDIDKLLKSDKINEYSGIYFEDLNKVAGEYNDKQDIRLIVPKDNEKFKDFINLRNRESQEKIEIPKDGAIVTEKLSKLLNITPGDQITVKDSYDNEKTVKVVAITEMYSGHFMIMDKSYLEKTFGDKFKPNADLIILKDGNVDNVKIISSEFMNIGCVNAVISNTMLKNQLNTIVDSLNKIMLILIIVATMLTIVILYNLTSINVQERIRELSTIKVLGFFDNEVTSYIYKETVILTILGILVGYILGDILFRYILRSVPPAEVMFNPSLTHISFTIPLIIVGIITVVLGIYVYKRLKNVDMLEALKSVE